MQNDGLFNVAVVLARALVRFGPRSREELLAACGLGVDGVDDSRAGTTLTRWAELGLFSTEDNLVSLREPYRTVLGKDPDIAESRLPKVLRTITLAPENNLRFWEAKENRSADLNRGLSWILAQDIYTIDTSSHLKIYALEGSQVADESKRILQNDTRWNGLRTWMIYLGFGRNGNPITVDPTYALRDSLDQIFGHGQTLVARDFVDRIAEELPVLDGGSYRKQIEDLLKGSTWAKLPEDTLSTALSRAIGRLRHEGVIATEQRSDTEAGITLIGAEQRLWLRMTHVLRIASRKGK